MSFRYLSAESSYREDSSSRYRYDGGDVHGRKRKRDDDRPQSSSGVALWCYDAPLMLYLFYMWCYSPVTLPFISWFVCGESSPKTM